jgi:hypothetical protein
MGDKLVPLSQAAADIGVHRATVHRYIRLGLLKRYRARGVDRRTYVDVEALRELRRHPPLEEAAVPAVTLNMRADHGPCLDPGCGGRIRDRRGGEAGGAPMQCDRCGALYTR